METSPRLKSLYSAARDGNIQDVRKSVISSRLSNEERCDWFCRAVIDKQKEVAKWIMYNGFLPKCESPKSQEGTAADEAKDELIKTLIQKVAKADDFPSKLFMDLAVKEGNEKLVSLLLAKGATVRSKVSGGFTAVQLAVMRGHLKVVEVLLAEKADVNSAYKGSTLLHAATFGGSDEIVALLLQNGAQVDAERRDGTTALYTAVEKGFTRIAERLITAGANVNTKFVSTDTVKDPCRERLIASENLLFLSCGFNPLQYPVNCRNDDKDLTVLHIAADRGNERVVELLVQNGADVNASDNFYRTPLYFAAIKLHEGVVRLLLEHGAEIDAKDADEHTALHLIAVGGCVRSAELVLKHGANVNACNWTKNTPLHLAADHDQAEVAELLLKKRANLEARCSNKWTPLMVAAKSGSAKVAEVLLRFGASTTAENQNKDTAFKIAVRNGHEQVVKLLLEQESTASCVEEDRPALLIYATKRGHMTMVEALLDSGVNVHSVDFSWRKRTPLHIAAEKGYREIVEMLLEHGADVEARDEEGVTALLLAVIEACRSSSSDPSRTNHLNVVITLLRYNANIQALDNNNRTPIKLAAFRLEEPAALKILLEYGSSNMHIVSEADALGLFDEVNREPMGSRGLFENPVEGTSEVLVKHFVKMKVAGLYVGKNTPVAKKFNDQDTIRAFQKECEAEIKKIKKRKIGNTDVSFYDILRSNLGQMAHLAKNESVIRALGSCDFEGEFPIYGDILYGQFDKVKMKDYREKGIRVCHFLLNRIRPMPYDVSEMLARRYLGRKSLRILTEFALGLKFGFDLFKHVIQDYEGK